jgi:hypothetical protein
VDVVDLEELFDEGGDAFGGRAGERCDLFRGAAAEEEAGDLVSLGRGAGDRRVAECRGEGGAGVDGVLFVDSDDVVVDAGDGAADAGGDLWIAEALEEEGLDGAWARGRGTSRA